MRKYSVTYLLILVCQVIALCQVPSGGTPIISDPLNNYSLWDPAYGTQRLVPATHPDFNQAIEVKTTSAPPNLYNFQLLFGSSTHNINKGDVVLFSFWGRTTASIQETGEGFVTAVIERNGDPYDKILTRSLSTGNEWTQYFASVEAPFALSGDNMSINLQVGAPGQTIEVSGIQVINYQNEYSIDEMPMTRITYSGRDPNASWRAEAAARIENLRKGDVRLAVMDSKGNPVENAAVEIEMVSHDFGFGTAVDAPTYNSNQQYRDTVNSLFNEVVFENDLKWRQWGWLDPNRQKAVAQAIPTLLAENMAIRGHVQVWPSFRNSPAFVSSKEKYYRDNPNELRTLINDHITAISTEYAGKLADWDVMNEPFDNFDFLDILGYTEMAEWFKKVKEIDPNVARYINDYSILSAGGQNVAKQDAYYETIERINKEGGDVTGIGMQSHFATQLTPIPTLKTILDRFSEFNVPIKVTEFDVNVEDPSAQADYTRDFYTMLFSHPNVESIIMWGFWENRHWRSNAAMITSDWSTKENYDAYRDLVFKEWWTQATGVSGSKGDLETRGFLGKYKYKVTYKGKVQEGTFDLKSNTEPTEVKVVLEKLKRVK